jgi:hypothetical protein
VFDRAPGRSAERDSEVAARTRVQARAVPSRLRVGAANDLAEREADRIADGLIAALGRATLPSTTSTRIARAVSRAPAEVGVEGGPLSGELTSRIRASRGTPLDQATRSTMESAMGVDLSAVRVHRDSDVAPRIQSTAFTIGTDIHFAPGAYQPAARSGRHLLAHELAHVVQQGGTARRVVQRYQVKTDSDGDTWRVSESGKSALWEQEKEGGRHLYMAPDLVKRANRKLRDAGTNGSFVRLSVDETRGIKTGLLDGVADSVRRVDPKLVAVGPDPSGQKLKLINEGGAKDDDGTKSAEFALFADCGRASRVVMGIDSTGTKPSAHRTIGATESVSAPSTSPMNFTDIYRLAMTKFMEVPENEKYLKRGVHYTRSKSGRTMVEPTTDKDAKKLYWELGARGRKAFDKFTGTNRAANPEIGGAYTIVTEKEMPGFKKQGRTWNFHWAGVVAKDGSNNITLENYAVSYGSSPDPDRQKELREMAYNHVNRSYDFQMYGTKKKGHTFHEEHLASGTHGNRGSTFAVKP